MNQYIFDSLYGSQAKKLKFTQTSNFAYYQTLLKLKDRHAHNKTLYNNLFEQHTQSQKETITNYNNQQKHQQQDEHQYQYKLREKSRKKIFNSLQRNNYTIQKINSHVYKIVKRKSFRNKTPGNAVSVNLKNIENGIISTPKNDKCKWIANIKTDANKIKRYLQSTQQKKSYRTISNFSTQLTKRDKNESQFSNSNNSDFLEKNKSFRITSTKF